LPRLVFGCFDYTTFLVNMSMPSLSHPAHTHVGIWRGGTCSTLLSTVFLHGGKCLSNMTGSSATAQRQRVSYMYARLSPLVQ